jgi:hypothetical protein
MRFLEHFSETGNFIVPKGSANASQPPLHVDAIDKKHDPDDF